MTRRLLAFVLAALSAPALAFDAVDTLPYPSLGAFPAYPASGAAALPFQLWGQAGVMFDNNVFRQPSATQSETVLRVGGGVRNDFQLTGRQVLRLQAEVNAMKYQTFGVLDHVAYGLLGEWRWGLGNDLDGTAGITRRQYQADLAEVARGVRDLITDTRFYANGAWRLGPTMRVRGGVDHARIERPARTFAELHTTGVTAGIDYVSALNNTIGLEGRIARADAPIAEAVAGAPGGFVNDTSDFREVALTGAYNIGPVLRTSGRIGHTQIKYSDFSSRDFNGTSARGRLEWLPGNKVILGIDLYNEPRTIIDVAATHVIVKGASFGASWAPTAKLVFATRFLHENRDFEGDPNVAVGGPVRLDTVRAFRVGSGWEVTRHVNIGLALDHGIRSSSAVGRDYNFTAIMANARYNF